MGWFIFHIILPVYRDQTIMPIQLSASERCELNASEKVRLDALGCTPYFSIRRERPLKIYTENGPRNSQNNGTTSTSATMNGSMLQSNANANRRNCM